MAKELLICVLNRPQAVEDVIAGFLEIGVQGCTIIDSKGMGKIISQDIPIFTGFKSMFAGARESNITLMSVMDEEMVEKAIELLEEIHQSFTEPGAGIVFSLPVSRVKGLKKTIEE